MITARSFAFLDCSEYNEIRGTVLQGLQNAAAKLHAEPVQRMQDAVRKSVGFGVSRTGSTTDIHPSSFESIGSQLGSRILASHSSSHDSDAGGARTGAATSYM